MVVSCDLSVQEQKILEQDDGDSQIMYLAEKHANHVID